MKTDILHFRGSEEIFKQNRIEDTIMYISDLLENTNDKSKAFKQALSDMGWRDDNLNIINDRRYQFKGLKNRLAIEANFSMYEYILEGLFRLQLGFDMKRIDAGVLFLNALRTNKYCNGGILKIIEQDVNSFYPTISLPVSLVIFDFKN